MDSTQLTQLYNFFVKTNTDQRGVEAALVLASVAGAAGYALSEAQLASLNAQGTDGGANLFSQELSDQLEQTFSELLRCAAAAGIDSIQESGWVGLPVGAEALKVHIATFNLNNFSELKNLYLAGGNAFESLSNDLLAISCLFLRQVSGTVIPESEGKRIITWALQCGARTML